MTLQCKIQTNKKLGELTTFGIGGTASYFVEVGTVDEMKEALQFCKDNSYRMMVLGKGSNTLFDDKGFSGLIIHNLINFIETPSPGCFYAGAGFSFSRLGSLTARKGWSGLEFASGIPGSVGGAVFMNAGANGTETCKSLASVEFMDMNGTIHKIEKKDLAFDYRFSSFQKMQGAILSATFQLEKSVSARELQLKIIDYRTKTQPYGEKSAGCIFRNPLPEQAGAIIDRMGLKGLSSGGAKVSERHANFIVNAGNSTSSDVLELIEMIKKEVRERSGIELESEVRYIPYEDKSSDHISS